MGAGSSLASADPCCVPRPLGRAMPPPCPRRRHGGKMAASEGGRKYATRCPFTGQRPTMRCPSCDARVHDSAFHKADPLVK